MTLKELLFKLTEDQPTDPIEARLARVGNFELVLNHPERPPCPVKDAHVMSDEEAWKTLKLDVMKSLNAVIILDGDVS